MDKNLHSTFQKVNDIYHYRCTFQTDKHVTPSLPFKDVLNEKVLTHHCILIEVKHLMTTNTKIKFIEKKEQYLVKPQKEP